MSIMLIKPNANLILGKESGSLDLGMERVRAVEEVYVGDAAPTKDKGYKIWITPGESPDRVVTKEELDEAIKGVIGGDIDLTGYATESYVNDAISAIELTPGPQGPQGEPGEDGKTPVKGVDYYTAEDKTAIVNDVLAALPAAEEVSV